MTACPCGLDKQYADCCGALIDDNQAPTSPEQLMRSRYTAYTQANTDYISRTMRTPAADHFDPISSGEFAKRAEWQRLEVVSSSTEGDKGFVEFYAHFNMNNKRHVIHEKSEFHLLDGRWYYVDGIDPKGNHSIAAMKVRRNEACLCGSGKKYKKCCGNKALL